MTDFEIVTLFNDLLNTSFARLNDFMVGLFALLITAYAAGRELSSRMAGLVILLYTLFSIATIVAAIASTHRFALAAGLVRRAGARDGSELSTLFPMLPSPEVVTPVMTLLLGAYVGGLSFFLLARRRPPNGQRPWPSTRDGNLP
jgi:hypothetical protein